MTITIDELVRRNADFAAAGARPGQRMHRSTR
jgi:hypothetical protein